MPAAALHPGNAAPRPRAHATHTSYVSHTQNTKREAKQGGGSRWGLMGARTVEITRGWPAAPCRPRAAHRAVPAHAYRQHRAHPQCQKCTRGPWWKRHGRTWGVDVRVHVAESSPSAAAHPLPCRAHPRDPNHQPTAPRLLTNAAHTEPGPPASMQRRQAEGRVRLCS